MKKIKLTQEKFALVDDDDHEALSQRKWHAHKNGNTFYAQSYDGEHSPRLNMHRMVLGVLPGFQVDHINGDGLDNRRVNLRAVTSTENTHNSRKFRGTSKYKGVSWNASHGQWQAQIDINRTHKYLGSFSKEELAAMAYDAAARELCGSYAALNFPHQGEQCAI